MKTPRLRRRSFGIISQSMSFDSESPLRRSASSQDRSSARPSCRIFVVFPRLRFGIVSELAKISSRSDWLRFSSWWIGPGISAAVLAAQGDRSCNGDVPFDTTSSTRSSCVFEISFCDCPVLILRKITSASAAGYVTSLFLSLPFSLLSSHCNHHHHPTQRLAHYFRHLWSDRCRARHLLETSFSRLNRCTDATVQSHLLRERLTRRLQR